MHLSQSCWPGTFRSCMKWPSMEKTAFRRSSDHGGHAECNTQHGCYYPKIQIRKTLTKLLINNVG